MAGLAGLACWRLGWEEAGGDWGAWIGSDLLFVGKLVADTGRRVERSKIAITQRKKQDYNYWRAQTLNNPELCLQYQNILAKRSFRS